MKIELHNATTKLLLLPHKNPWHKIIDKIITNSRPFFKMIMGGLIDWLVGWLVSIQVTLIRWSGS